MFDARLFPLSFLMLLSLAVGVMFGFLFGYQEGEFRCRFDTYFKQSPAVSVIGSGDLPDHPPTPPPVAGAGGETG